MVITKLHRQGKVLKNYVIISFLKKFSQYFWPANNNWFLKQYASITSKIKMHIKKLKNGCVVYDIECVMQELCESNLCVTQKQPEVYLFWHTNKENIKNQ